MRYSMMKGNPARFSLLSATLLGLCLATLLSAGCMEILPDSGQEAGGSAGAIRLEYLTQEADWSFGRGCTWAAEYQVSNQGDAAAKNVRINIQLIGRENGAVRDSRTISLGTLSPGEVRTVSAELDGECLTGYTLRVVPEFQV